MRFLDSESESASSASSIGLHVPSTPRGECERERDILFTTDGDLSGNALENPAISFMEVELSMTTHLAGFGKLEQELSLHEQQSQYPSTSITSLDSLQAVSITKSDKRISKNTY